jgi:hypothetical protein
MGHWLVFANELKPNEWEYRYEHFSDENYHRLTNMITSHKNCLEFVRHSVFDRNVLSSGSAIEQNITFIAFISSMMCLDPSYFEVEANVEIFSFANKRYGIHRALVDDPDDENEVDEVIECALGLI